MQDLINTLISYTNQDTILHNVNEIVGNLYKNNSMYLHKNLESFLRTPGSHLISSEIYDFHNMMRGLNYDITYKNVFKELQTILELEISPKCFNTLSETVTLYRTIHLDDCPGSLESPAKSYISTVDIQNIQSLSSIMKNVIMIIEVHPGTILFNLNMLGEQLETGEIILDKGGTLYVKECIINAVKYNDIDIDILKVTYFPRQHCATLYPHLDYKTLVSSACSTLPTLFQDGIQSISQNELVDRYIDDVHNCEHLNRLIISRFEDTDIRIVTYNVHEWKDKKDNDTKNHCVQAILDINPDIVCLQEATVNIPDKLLEMYPYHVMEDSEPFNDYRIYVVILSKYKITSSEKFFLNDDLSNSREVRKSVYASMLINGKNVHVCNVHLSLDVNVATNQISLLKNKVFKSQSHQHSDQKRLKSPLIICGDFNHIDPFNYTKYELEWLKKNYASCRYVYNSIRTMMNISSNNFNFNKIRYTVWSSRSVDYIFPNLKFFKYVYSGIYYTTSSDHLPYFMDLKLR